MAGPERIVVLADEFAERHCLQPTTLARFAALGELRRFSTEPGAWDGEDFRSALVTATALLVTGWTPPPIWLNAADLAAAPRLSFVGCGQDNRWRFLDVQAALAAGITCCDSTGAMGTAVAEFAVGLLLCCLRGLPDMHNRVATGGWWDGWEDANSVFPTTLSGRSVGLVGMGRTGVGIARMLGQFGCVLSAWSSHLTPEAASALDVRRAATVGELCADVDVLIVATQPRADTIGIVDAAAVSRLRPGAIVILVGRASTVDVGALYDRVRAGDLRLGIDVYEEEPLVAHHPLRGLPGVVHTPHIAGRTVAANAAVVTELAADLERHRARQPTRWATTATRASRSAARSAVRR